MALLEELYVAIYSKVGGAYPSDAPALDWYGEGDAPATEGNPVLSWFLVSSVETTAMQIGTDYYGNYVFQFSADTKLKASKQAIEVLEAVKTIFRDNDGGMTLSTGRVVDIDIGSTRTVPTGPGARGKRAFVDITFVLGT